ncbi:AAA family ATPase [Faecalibacterium sp. 7]|uniref:AAA family ATPase n=1 Tax=Faecalibacterium sp. 7 TaxID=3402017 RepID=UPI003C3064E8
MSVKIMALEAENVKRIKAVALTPLPTGLTLVGGNNNQGKTSVLDALAWALGGDRFRPDAAQRDGAVAPAHLKVRLSNGVVVERKGKNSTLTVTDPTGRRSGQQLLNAFIEPLALICPASWKRPTRRKPTSCSGSSASAPNCTPGILRSNPCTTSAPSPASWPRRKSTLPRS